MNNDISTDTKALKVDEQVIEKKVVIYRELAKELIRYSFVGVSSFFLDAYILHVCKIYLFAQAGEAGVLFSSTIGFIVGLVYNYTMSIKFVFKDVENNKRTMDGFIVFTIIGIIGFLLTEIGMIIGMKILTINHYMAVKIIVALIVFVWNYTARKKMVFK